MVAGGKERRLTELMKALKLEPGVQFELVVMSKEIHYKEVLELGIQIHYLIRKTKKDISVFNKFYKICKHYKPDIVHCWDSMTAVYSVPACKLLNIKFANGMVVDAPQKQNIFNKAWFRAKLTFLFSDVVIGNSKAGLAAYGVSQTKAVCIYNGFNFDRTNGIIPIESARQQLEIDTKYVIGMVATFSSFKDHKTYFAAAELLLDKRNDITFLAIGNETDSTQCRDLIQSKYLENFRLLGKRSGVESIVNTMDIGVLATFTEGISNAILEYMALEKPVIATSGGGTNEIIVDNKTGFLVSQSNPGELANKIEILLTDSELRKGMGQAGQERIKTIFSIGHMTAEYISLYKKLSSNNKVK